MPDRDGSAAIAAFDFDGTLTHRDSVVPFLRRFTSTTRFVTSLVPHTLRLVPAALRRDRDELRSIATGAVFRGVPVERIAEEAAAHAAEIVSGGLRHDTTARLGWHVAAGHRVVIVSASYEDYLRPVAASFGEVEVLGTRLEVADGVGTGRLDGANCRGAEKVRRLESWLAARSLERADLTVYAYGDSAGDHELLAWADHPHRVTEPLASVAPTV